MVEVQLSWIFGPQLTWSPHSITSVIISKSASTVLSATFNCYHIGLVGQMYLEPSSQLTTRTPSAFLWSCAKIAFAKMVRSDYFTSAPTALHLGKFVSPDRRTGVKSMDENGNMGEISKTFTDTPSQQLEHRPEDQLSVWNASGRG